jgi:uncharacterized protein
METLWAVIARDRPGAEPKRLAVRDAHFAYVETILDRIAVAGPLRTESGGFAGSVLIYHAANEAEARALLEADPYWAADIWESVTIEPFMAAVGTWVGGKRWR